MKKVTQELKIGIDPDHDFFLVNGRKDIYLAMLLTTIKAYMVSILDKNGIKNAKKVATEYILEGEIVDDFIYIKKPPEMKNGGEEDSWKIFMTVEGSHQFFMQTMYPSLE